MTDARVLLAVDGNSLLHRAFHAQAGSGLRSADGAPLWAVRGLLSQLVAAVERVDPVAIVVGFDDPDSSSRRARWPQYKAGRADKADTLVAQLSSATRVLAELGVHVVVPDGLEADDVLASTARFAPSVDATTVIMTSDRDAFSLIDDHTRVLRIINGGVEASPLLTAERLVSMLGVRPDQYRDYAALRGDASDNLPGVRGIGPKTAAQLLSAFGSAVAVFDALAAGSSRVSELVGPARARTLADPRSRAAWELNCQIMTMRADLPIGLDLAGGPGSLPFSPDRVRSVFERHQLTWSLRAALRVLCDRDEPIEERPLVDDSRGWFMPAPPGGARRHAPLPPAPARSDQLSLFD